MNKNKLVATILILLSIILIVLEITILIINGEDTNETKRSVACYDSRNNIIQGQICTEIESPDYNSIISIIIISSLLFMIGIELLNTEKLQ